MFKELSPQKLSWSWGFIAKHDVQYAVKLPCGMTKEHLTCLFATLFSSSRVILSSVLLHLLSLHSLEFDIPPPANLHTVKCFFKVIAVNTFAWSEPPSFASYSSTNLNPGLLPSTKSSMFTTVISVKYN